MSIILCSSLTISVCITVSDLVIALSNTVVFFTLSCCTILFSSLIIIVLPFTSITSSSCSFLKVLDRVSGIVPRYEARSFLLIFSLILSPAAAAYQLTYSMKYLFLLSAGFAVLSSWIGLLFSYLLNIPSGPAIVITASLIFALAAIFSPKKKTKAIPQGKPEMNL